MRHWQCHGIHANSHSKINYHLNELFVSFAKATFGREGESFNYFSHKNNCVKKYSAVEYQQGDNQQKKEIVKIVD
jgi:hypothetical protein